MPVPSCTSPFVTYEVSDNVARIHFDDGKVNVLSHDTIAAVREAFNQAEAEAKAVVLVGRPGVFTAGFDLKMMQAGVDSASPLFLAGMELFLRLYEFSIPVVVACTGHCLAAGAILLMCCDLRIGADVNAKIGLNETALGMVMPTSVVTLARDRLAVRHVQSAIFQARMYSPKQAVDVGFLDRVVDEDKAESTALQEASELTEYLSLEAFAGSRQSIRGPVAETVREQLEQDALKLTMGRA